MPRNLSGVYTLPAGNPVVPGTTIDAAWANSTLEDISNELTNSLSRTGAGGMLAPFRIADGNVTGPGLSFLNETNSGFYRVGAGSTAFSILGVNTLQMNTTAVTIPSARTLNAQGNALVGGTLGVTGAATFSSTLAATGAITATGGVLGNITAASGTSTFNNVTINGSLDMVAGSSATITGLSNPTNASDAANKDYVDTQDALKLNLTGGTLSGNLAMGNNLVTGLGTPVSGGDATNKTYVDGQIATRLALAGGTMSGAIAMGTNKITGLGTPTADADAATKAYVDSVAQGLDVKASCRAATTGNITLSGTQTIDGVAVIAGDRVLVKDQSTASQNGIYVAAAGSWSRAADANTWDELVGAFVFIEDGTTNDNSGWVCTVAPGGTLGSTAVTFEQFSGAGQITAGAGMVKVGNTLNVQSASSSRIVVGADEIDLATTGVGAGTYKSVTVDTYGRVTAGTNPTTLAGYGITDAYTSTATDTLLNGKLSLTGGTMSGPIAMGTNKVTGVGDPTNAQDAATKNYTDTGLNAKLSLSGGTMTGALAMGTYRITGMGDPVNAQDAATKNYIDTIFGSTTSAAASAAAAAASASSASSSASSASSSASSASSSASTASTALFNFRAQYLGPLSSDPTVDGNGNAVTAGDLYWNTVANETRIYNGSAWVAAYLPAAGYMDLTTNQTAAGVKTFSSNPILSGGTANGVAYLNASKALTTGSALTFDGTNISTALGGSYYSANANYGFGTPDSAGLQIFAASGDSIRFGSRSAGTFSEQMRLTSTGLGIGTSSPAQTLHVKTATAATPITLGVLSNATTLPAISFNGAYASTTMAGTYSLSGSLYTTVPSGAAQYFSVADSIKLTLDASGNLGLGVTPSAWGSGSKVIQINRSPSGSPTTVALGDVSNEGIFSRNAYNDGTWKYVLSDVATRYQQSSGGQHQWFTAPSGTAGNAISFTQAMDLANSGGASTLTVNSAINTASAVRLTTNGGVNAGMFLANASVDSSLGFQTAGSERARITSGGVIGINSTNPSTLATRLAALQPSTPSGTLPTYYFNAGWDNQGAQDNIGMLLQYNGGLAPNGSLFSARIGGSYSFTLNNNGNFANQNSRDRPPVYLYAGPTFNSYGQPNTTNAFALGMPLSAIFSEMSMWDGVPVVGQSIRIAGSYGGGSTRDAYGCAVQLTTAFGAAAGYGTSYGYYANVSSNTTANWAFFAAAGDAAKPGGGSWSSSSDARVKTVLGDYQRGLSDLLKLHVVDFEYNGKAETPTDGRRYTGLIAQEAQEVMPELIQRRRAKLNPEDEDYTDILMVDNSSLVYALVNAVRELKSELDAVKAELATLKGN